MKTLKTLKAQLLANPDTSAAYDAMADEFGMAREPPASRPHDAAVVELLKADPDFANEYLAAALEEADQPGGQAALLAALRHVAQVPQPAPANRAVLF